MDFNFKIPIITEINKHIFSSGIKSEITNNNIYFLNFFFSKSNLKFIILTIGIIIWRIDNDFSIIRMRFWSSVVCDGSDLKWVKYARFGWILMSCTKNCLQNVLGLEALQKNSSTKTNEMVPGKVLNIICYMNWPMWLVAKPTNWESSEI